MLLIKWVVRILFKVTLVVTAIVAVLFTMFNWPVKEKNDKMVFGISFSNVFARDLGMDWKEVYRATIDDLGVKKLRIAAYWTEIEKEKGTYDFSDLDWQVDEAEKKGIKLILAFGIKSPRWPECFIPEFYKNNKQEREDALLVYEKALIERYRDKKHIQMWQVENEPFLPFGNCIEGAVDAQLVDREITQAQKFDKGRPIMLTDSGELSIWIPAARRGNYFGTTLYRIIHKPPIGYIEYPIGPRFFRMKAGLTRFLADQDNIIISELQAEPWGPGWLPQLSIEEQYKSMDPQKFLNIVEYAQQTGLSESYLWGVEWWYWLKAEKNNTEMWDTVKDFLSKVPTV